MARPTPLPCRLTMSRSNKIQLDFQRWLRESAAGLMITGSSGTGKSQLMRLIMKRLAASGEGLWLLDPHGDLARDVELDTTTLPKRHRDRVVIIRPSDVRNGVASINPLHVSRDGCSELQWRSRLAVKVMHVSTILLAAWGEENFNSKPVLAKWMTRFLMLLAIGGLPISAVRYFFDPSHPVYQALSQIAPDFVTRMEMEELAALRPKEREEIIASTKNRFLGWLANPTIELNVGKTEGVFDVRQLIQQRAIVIISLETGEGDLHDTDVEILANLWLSEIVFAIFNTPRDKRVDTTIFLDELPIFNSSFQLLSKVLPQCRKLKARWVTAFQGAYVFRDAIDNPLLNLIIGQCRTHFVFGHSNHRDCEFFGKVVKFRNVDLMRRKHTTRQTQQIQVGHDVVTLYDESTNWSNADQHGNSQAEGTTQTTTNTDTSSSTTNRAEKYQLDNTLQRAVTDARGDTSGSSLAQADGSTTTSTENWSQTRTQGGGVTRKQTLVPRLESEVIEHIQFMTPDEQFIEVASKIAGFDVGQCVIHRSGKGAWITKLPMVRNRFRRTPQFAHRQVQTLYSSVFSRPQYESPARISQRQDEFTENLVCRLNALPHKESAHSPALLIDMPARELHPEITI